MNGVGEKLWLAYVNQGDSEGTLEHTIGKVQKPVKGFQSSW